MNIYLILGICAAVLVLGYSIRRWKDKRVFQKYARLHASVLLDNQTQGRNRVMGSFLFNLEILDSEIKEIVFTGINSSNSGLVLKDFEQINFYRTAGALQIPVRSIGFKTSRKKAKDLLAHNLYVQVDGYIMTYERHKIRFSLTNQVEKQEDFAFPKAALFDNTPLAY